MKKDKFNIKLRGYVKENLTPTEQERKFVSKIYNSFKSTLDNNCIQIGSFPRFTAIRPLHDLDILYILGEWDEKSHNPLETLKKVYSKIEDEYKNPTEYIIKLSLQTHSITITYLKDKEEMFSIDIVPAYIFSQNEFGEDTYKVPEILRIKHGKGRSEFYERVIRESKEIGWILSDPRGYIEVAKRTNQTNNDFRKSVKFIKAWKNSCKDKDDNFKLKSFHIEQVITNYFQRFPSLDIFDSIFMFMVRLSQIIERAQIPDRADSTKYIDEYINELTRGQKDRIIEARDCFLIRLEEMEENDSIEYLVDGCFYRRHSGVEQYLFDFNIPTFTDDEYLFEIAGELRERDGGFRKTILSKFGLIKIDRQIDFKIKGTPPSVDLFKWKVKNDNSCKEPRGEITDHHTLRQPEESKFKGNHFVACYAILNNVCVAKARQNVKLESIYN
jgi:Adenylyl/Guanylyl and SMODS C-terminal sensor domain